MPRSLPGQSRNSTFHVVLIPVLVKRSTIHRDRLARPSLVVIHLSEVSEGRRVGRFHLKCLAKILFGLGVIAGFAIHPGQFDVRLSQVRLRVGPGDEHLLRFAMTILLLQQARQRVVRRLVHRVNFQRVPEQLLGLACLPLFQHRHAQVVRVVRVVRRVHRRHAEMACGLGVVAVFEGPLAEVVVHKPVRPAAPCGEYTQTKNGQDGPVHAHSAASFANG